MPKLAQYQADALLVLRTRLNVDDPRNAASDEVKAHLRAIRPWLDSWVLPAVECIDSPERWVREEIARQAYGIRRREVA